MVGTAVSPKTSILEFVNGHASSQNDLDPRGTAVIWNDSTSVLDWGESSDNPSALLGSLVGPLELALGI